MPLERLWLDYERGLVMIEKRSLIKVGTDHNLQAKKINLIATRSQFVIFFYILKLEIRTTRPQPPD